MSRRLLLAAPVAGLSALTGCGATVSLGSPHPTVTVTRYVVASAPGASGAFGDPLGSTADPGAATDDIALRHFRVRVADDGCGVIRSGRIGDDLTWVVRDRGGFEVLGRVAAGETRYRYYRPGRYTVRLQAWGGSYYRDVSNVVSITC